MTLDAIKDDNKKTMEAAKKKYDEGSFEESRGIFLQAIIEIKYIIVLDDKEGSLSYKGINNQLINTSHEIHEIIDKDHFTIKLENINLEPLINDNKGGNNVIIYVKDLFRLHFNQKDTIGRVLGFRNIGSETSITYYNFLITIQWHLEKYQN